MPNRSKSIPSRKTFQLFVNNTNRCGFAQLSPNRRKVCIIGGNKRQESVSETKQEGVGAREG